MRLSFHGAVREVTGSCFLLETKEATILVDCGMFQGERMCAEKNFETFGFDPAKIDAVFVTHSHLDHTGRLPILHKGGFNGLIYMTEPAIPLSRLVLEDAFHIMSENAKRSDDKMLYELHDLEQTFQAFKSVNYHEAIQIKDCSIMFHDAGHILGSAYISIETEGKRIVFSGDIGNNDVPILNATEPISHADYVVCESTYGARIHEPVATRTKKLQTVIENVLKEKGVLLIPAFSIERSQELLYELNNLVPTLSKQIPIFLDSPLSPARYLP